MPSSENFKVYMSVDGSWTMIGYADKSNWSYYGTPQVDESISKQKEEINGVKVLHTFMQLFPDLENTAFNCPECSNNLLLVDLIMHLNDDHKMSRNNIADWLETLDADLTFKEKDVPSV